MKKLARISTAAFLAGVTTLSVTLPMPASAGSRSASAEPSQSSASVTLPRRTEVPGQKAN